MLKSKNLSNGFLAEAINIAVCLKNSSPTRSVDFKTPFKALLGYKPVINYLRFFGSKSFAHVPKEDMKTLCSRPIKCIFVWYYTEFNAYKLFNPFNHKVFASRDVVFHEQVDDGNHDRDNEEWHMPLLVEDGSDETRGNHEKQAQKQKKEEVDGTDAFGRPSPQRDDQNRFEASPPLWRLSRKI